METPAEAKLNGTRVPLAGEEEENRKCLTKSCNKTLLLLSAVKSRLIKWTSKSFKGLTHVTDKIKIQNQR